MKKLILILFLFVGTLSAQDTMKLKKYGARHVTAKSLQLMSYPLIYVASKSEDPEAQKAVYALAAFLNVLAFSIEYKANYDLSVNK